jgi:cation diffusion facilitator family transporter
MLRRMAIAVLVVNLVLATLKGLVWYLSGSIAVGSEAVNSLADTTYSLVIVAGIYATTRPPDFEHPHGHERIEPFVSLFVALGIFAAAGGIAWQAIGAILTEPTVVKQSPAAVAVLLLSAAAKYSLYRYCLRIGTERNSPALIATAKDNRNDILTAGAALLGVLGASAGVPMLDPIAAIVVAIGIAYTGYEVVRENVGYLVGAAPPEDLRSTIVDRALAQDHVEGAHDVVAHYVGPEIDVSLHVEVTGEKTLREAHSIESAVIDAVAALPEVDDVFVHVDPKELGEWKDDDPAETLGGEEPD